MDKKKILTLGASLGLVTCIGIGATLAYFTDKEATENIVTMGHVNIDLTEPVFSETHEGNTISNVTPNQVIYKDPIITVKQDSENAYIRAKIEFEGLSDDQINQILPNINIDKEKWTLGADNYYYYDDVLTPGQAVYLFSEVRIPEGWGNEVVNKTFNINVKAEAVQADNFTPATDNGNIVGWNGVTAETYPGPDPLN